MAEQSNSASNPPGSAVDTKESELHMQSETASSSTHLLERNVKQIHIKEESTIKKVLRTREVKHFNAAGEEISPNNIQASSSVNEAFSDHEASGNDLNTVGNSAKHIDDRLGNQSKSNINDEFVYNAQQNAIDTQQHFSDPTTETTNANYQNITATINANNPSASYNGMISSQQPTNLIVNQPPGGQPYVQTIQHSTNRVANLPQSGYEELDSTLGFSNQQPVKFLVSDQGTSNYGMTKAHPHMQQHMLNQPIVVQQDPNTHTNYDVAYGRAGLMSHSQIPMMSPSSEVYGVRSSQEPVYAINRNGNLTLVTPNTLDGEADIRWRDPDLEEVIGFMSSPDPMIRANSVAYLQHLSFGDDNVKQKTRLVGGIPILIDLLNRDILEVQRNVCGALRNLSFGRKNDDNKRAIRDAMGLQALSRTLADNSDNETRELATSVLWNLSSCEDIKWSIIDDSLATIVSVIIVPYTDWFKTHLSSAQQFLPTASETHWSTVFRNSTGVLRNISSAGAHARKQLRECDGLIESLFFIINVSISRNDVENKLVENCVCILRNLSYRCQETQDPDYERHYFNANGSQTESTNNSMQNSPSSPSSSANLTTSLVGQVGSRVSDNLGCFRFARKSKSKSKLSFLSSRTNSSSAQSGDRSTSSRNFDNNSHSLLPPHHSSTVQANTSATMIRTSTKLEGFNSSSATLPRSNVSNISPYGTTSMSHSQTKAQELLWQPEVVKPYLALLSGCSNSETLEAAAGAIQNLAACYWQPSIDIRASVRKERGLPVLVELLRMDRDRVVCVVATALRNLAIDQKNKDLIGKYAMLDLVNKLASNQSERDSQTSDDTIAAVLATLHEVISNNIDFVKSLYESGGLNKLNFIVRNSSIFSSRVQRFAAQVLLDMWKFTELREMYKKGGWKESHFIVRPHLASKNSTFSINSNTIERPIASQQTDRSSSMRNLRAIGNPISMNSTTQNAVNMVDLNQYPQTQVSMNAVQMATLNGQMNNPLYAQVDRHRKRNEVI